MEIRVKNMKEDNLLNQELDVGEINTHRYFQVDLLKAVMILLVIFDHTVPWALKDYMFVSFWERISIPVFLVIMGFNMGLSFSGLESRSLKTLYSWSYFKRKFWRYLFPFLILLGLTLIIGSIFLNFYDYPAFEQYRPMFHFSNMFLGILQFWGPGNWFIPVIFLSILIMPLIYKGMSGKLIWRITTLLLCFLVEISTRLIFHEFVVEVLLPPSTYGEYIAFLNIFYMLASSPLFLLSGIGLGMWFSRRPNIFAKQNLFMWILAPLSFYYLILNQLDELGIIQFTIDFIHNDYNFLVFPYSAFLFLLVLKIFPKKPKKDNIFIRGIRTLSNSTYHILLTQILYFAITVAIWGDHYGASIYGIDLSYNPLVVFLYLLINWSICIPLGVLWSYGESKVRNYRLKRRDSIIK